ncbi:MAG TPA: prephenate dehydratase [Mycobacteriales bacterium]|nr:prephenate dehydratase [Mycobacteriales bacterium]
MRYAYLGPAGTFAEAALRTLPSIAEAVPAVSVVAALEMVRAGTADCAVVPFENSVEGSVPTTLDELAVGGALHVVREVVLPVSFALLARRGTGLAEVRTVATHPHAEAQCRRWLAAHVPGAQLVLAPSTADAARLVGEGTYDAAVSAPVAAQHYGLVALASDIHDNEGAQTRFVVVARPGQDPAPTGKDRTTVVLFLSDDHPGALLEILTEFATRGVNLTRIESRPTGGGLGRYCFSIDLEGHRGEVSVTQALAALEPLCSEVRFLGSYPRAY